MQYFKDQIITLAAICQIAKLVQNISRQGTIDDSELTMFLNSVLNTSPESALAIYGDDISHLNKGLKALLDHLGNHTNPKDPEITRYVVSLLSLERRLTKDSSNLNNSVSVLNNVKDS